MKIFYLYGIGAIGVIIGITIVICLICKFIELCDDVKCIKDYLKSVNKKEE